MITALDTIQERLKDIQTQASIVARVPVVDPSFVPHGEYALIKQVIASRFFMPSLITGEPGNGKSFSVEQACAETGREFIRTSITVETAEDDLLGGFRLYQGNTVFEIGPAVIAMLRGAVLLLDELDYASPKIACLQALLEGKPILIKKLGVTITPEPGFTVIGTMNTKGRGDVTGKFIGVNFLNDAFLDRFVVTIEQDYPSEDIERTILTKAAKVLNIPKTYKAGPGQAVFLSDFIDTLVKWAALLRESHRQNTIDDVVTTRRLVHILRLYMLTEGEGGGTKAVSLAVARYSLAVAVAMSEMYNRFVPSPNSGTNVGHVDTSNGVGVDPDDDPFD